VPAVLLVPSTRKLGDTSLIRSCSVSRSADSAALYQSGHLGFWLIQNEKFFDPEDNSPFPTFYGIFCISFNQ
jgi:hypothetical protein